MAVGSLETSEFHRQAQMYVSAFTSAKRTIEFYKVPNVDHFDELNALENTDSLFFKKTIKLIKNF